MDISVELEILKHDRLLRDENEVEKLDQAIKNILKLRCVR